jgi:23S rRNA (cytidine1920-2'-O)/16S rRNA (cytidine1409-2'-O)-methyltransferase
VKKRRLDLILFEKGLVESRNLAQRLVMAGEVRVNGQVVLKPASKFEPEVQIEIIQRPAYVSRGGEKLDGALRAFQIPITGLICADVGASTGGFTDCLLQHGAQRVYAIDVGKGILHWKLRQDERVIVMEKTNARYVKRLPEPVDLVTVDASFISLKILLPVIKNWFQMLEEAGEPRNLGQIIALIKPQFEAGKAQAKKGAGVIRDPKVHRAVLKEILTFSQDQGFTTRGLIRSPIKGPKGNIEFLVWMLINE